MGISGVPLDKNEIIKALYQKDGIITQAAASIACAPATIYEWVKSDPDVAFALKDAREKADQAYIETNIRLKQKAYKSTEALLDEGDTTMTIFIMKTLGGLKETATNMTVNIQTNDKPYNESDSTGPT